MIGSVMNEEIHVSALGKTWIFDIDGTLCKHNGYKIDGHDTILPGVSEFFAQLSDNDRVILVTSRKKEYAQITEAFLHENNLRYDAILYEMPYGERILINDKKPSGLITGIAVNTERDVFMQQNFVVDPEL